MTYFPSHSNTNRVCLLLSALSLSSLSLAFVPRPILTPTTPTTPLRPLSPLIPMDRATTFYPFTQPAVGMKSAKLERLESERIHIVESKVTERDAEEKKQPSLLWKGVVLGICLVWSTNFAVIKEIFAAAPTIDPSLYAAIRFSLASLVMLPRTFNSIKNIELIGASAAVGMSVFFGYFGQSIGLMTTTANKSSFICSLNVVWVALVSSLLKKELKVQALISAFLAVVGVAVLELDVIGDLWSLCQPIGFGTGYLLLERVVAKYPENPGAITAFKIISIALASICWAASCGHTLADLGPIMESPVAVGGLLYTGLITTAAALWIQSYAFEEVPATDVSIILSTEPIFATIFAAGLIGEAISIDDIAGGGIILAACLSNEFNLYDNFVAKREQMKNT